MRKLITILLITAIACAEVDTTPKANKSKFKELFDLLDLDLDSVELNWNGDFFVDRDIRKEIREMMMNELKKNIHKYIDKLKNNGFWNQLVSIAKTGGKLSATNFCSKYTTEEVCKLFIYEIFNSLEKY